MLWKLIGMIILGLISAGFSYYKKNYFVNIFNDILGRDDDDDPATRVGRGFIYGFLFPIYFSLLLTGLAILISFLIGAGVVAAIVFALVWLTEKVFPQAWLGNFIVPLFNKIGLKGAKVDPKPCCTVQSDIYPPCDKG